MSNVIVHRPQKGFQEQLLLTDKVNFVIAGSGAGVGKSWCLLYDALRYSNVKNYYAVVFRRNYSQIFSSIIPQAMELYEGVRYSKFVKSPRPNYTFYDDPKFKKQRSIIQFSHMLHDKDRLAWQGAQVSRFYLDEITHFSKVQVFYLFSRLRSQTDVTPRLLGTCNPDPDSFILDILDAGGYIQQDGFPDPGMEGKVQWMVHKENEYIFGKDREELARKTGISEPMSFTFIPGNIFQNKKMLDKNPQYLSMLQGLPEHERNSLLHSNWRSKLDGDLFRRSFFNNYYEDDICDVIDIRHKAIFMDCSMTQGKSSDYTVMLCAGVDKNGRLYILDMVRDKFDPLSSYRVAEAFYRKHDRKQYTIIDYKTGSTTTVNSAPLLGMFIEYAVNGISIFQVLKKKGLRVGPIKRSGDIGKIKSSDYGNRGRDKVARAIAVLPLIEKAGIWLPNSDGTFWSGHDKWVDKHIKGILEPGESVKTNPKKWIPELKNELLSFKQGENKKEISSQHDDITDTVIDAATFLLESRSMTWIQAMIQTPVP